MIDVHFLLFLFRMSVAMTMREFAELFEGFSRAAGPVVFTALWQGAVVAVGLAVCLRLARRASAAHRFSIWAAGFAALVCLPFLPFLMARAAGAVASGWMASGSIAGAASSGPWLRLDLRWSLAIGAVWIVASVFRAVVLGVHSLQLRRLWKTATPIEDGDIVLSQVSESRPGAPGMSAAVNSPKAGWWAGRKARVCTTRELDRPAVIGFLAPRILIPEWLFARLTGDELEHVILHESEHLRRYDDWINLVQKLCLIVFPLNPALVWMERRLCSEREMACDDGVIRVTQAPRAHAACLASLAERGLKHRADAFSDALSLGAWQRRPELVQRVHRILRRTPGLSPLATRALVGALSSGLILGAIEFARCPQLVAFVPAPRLAAHQSAASELGDARYVDAQYRLDGHNGAGSGFRAIDAVAQMPAASDYVAASGHVNVQATGAVSAKQSSAKQAGSTLQNPKNATLRNPKNATREVLLKAEIPNQSAEQREEQVQPEWIVFTAWEQVETSGPDNRGPDNRDPDNRGAGHRAWNHETGLRQDYDSAATEDQAAGDSKNQAQDGAGGATITHLILEIYPASGFMTTSKATFSADQPVAIPLRDGWFVFQL